MMIGQTLYRSNGIPCYNFIGQTPRRFEKRQWRFKKWRLWTVVISFLKRLHWQKKSALALYVIQVFDLDGTIPLGKHGQTGFPSVLKINFDSMCFSYFSRLVSWEDKYSVVIIPQHLHIKVRLNGSPFETYCLISIY